MARDPGYWMAETSGALGAAVPAYLAGLPMSGEHIAAMRAYLRQWIGATVWDENPHSDKAERAWLARMRAAIDGLTTREAIERWLDEAVNAGIDPL